jgi:hypothetical protein
MDRNNADKPHHPDIEERIGGVREGVTDADATGLIAGEQLITQAETLLPLSQPAELPHNDLHAALPRESDAHATIDDLHAEINREKPNAAAIKEHVGVLSGLPELRATVAIWWEDPKTQRFFADLGQIGV